MDVLQDYYDFQEERRRSVLGSLGRKYHAIGPLLVKVEGLVVQSNTGKCPRLARYYEHWEAKVFQSLVKVRRVHTHAFCKHETRYFFIGVHVLAALYVHTIFKEIICCTLILVLL